jgi:Ca-activated chloride channel family protein
MTKTRLVFFALIIIALVVVAVSYFTQRSGRLPLAAKPELLSVRIVCALPVEPFITEAAKQFNAEKHTLEGHPVEVSVVPMDGLVAMSRWEREEMTPLPTVWIPDSRYLVELVNATYKEKRGRDIFLTGGEYRTRPIATSLFCWGIWQSRDEVLRKKYGEEITWQAIHDAAAAKGGWPELGGKAEWGYFKLVVPNPRKNVGGLMSMVAAAGEYHQKTRISVSDVTDPAFQAWLKELMGAVTDFSSLGSYSVENLALFGYSMGDGGQLLESDLLVNMAGIRTRWVEPMVVRYPKYITWFDFPYTIWMGEETSALEKNAALEFERYLLKPEVQRLAIARGLRPANPEVPITEGDSLFVKWQEQGVTTVVPRSTSMHSPDREVLLALLRWFDLNIYER